MEILLFAALCFAAGFGAGAWVGIGEASRIIAELQSEFGDEWEDEYDRTA